MVAAWLRGWRLPGIALTLLAWGALFFAAVWIEDHPFFQPTKVCLEQPATPEERVSRCTRAIAVGHSNRFVQLELKYARGQALIELERYAEALRDFEDVLSGIRASPQWKNQSIRVEPAEVPPEEENTAPVQARRGISEFFVNLGYARWGAGDTNAAHADFSQAIAIDPRNGAAYRWRSWVRTLLGDYGAALDDARKALQVIPANTDYLRFHARLAFDSGSFSEAWRGFSKLSELENTNAYWPLWAVLSRERSSEAVGRSSDVAMVGSGVGRWPAPVVRFYRGEVTEAELMAAVEEGAADERGGRLCEATFYVGQHYLLRDRPETAEAYVRQAHKICPEDFVEYRSAHFEIKRLERRSTVRP